MSKLQTLIKKNTADIKQYQELNWSGSFDDYLTLVENNPKTVRNAHQRLYDMIMSHGTEEYTFCKRNYIKYNFFQSKTDRVSIYGLEEPLMTLMDSLRSASYHYGPERRILLLHGPVGSSKSTIVTALKKGLEDYSRSDEGALYSFSWIIEENGTEKIIPCTMNEEPLKLLPTNVRKSILEKLNSDLADDDYILKLDGHISPANEYYRNELLKKYEGDYTKVLNHIVVHRVLLSEKDRIGIGTFQPKDEKSQDATELTGDINYRKLAMYGSESDPRAFDFDGEFLIANRGIIEFQEVLKLQTEFLYDLLGATQEHRVKPKRFNQIPIDEVIIGHTNNAEFEKLKNNKFMEALRDRTLKIDVPYLLRVSNEQKIYDFYYNSGSVNKHIAPHTTYLAALFAVVSRIAESSKHDMSLIQKAKLYDGKSVHGFTEEHIKEMQEEEPEEGLKGQGVSARFIQNQFSNAIVNPRMGSKSINPFMLFAQIREGLKAYTGYKSEDHKKELFKRLELVEKEYDRIVKREVQQALSSSEQAIKALCTNYIDNIVAYIQDEKVVNPITGKDEPPNEQLMRSIEEKIGIAAGMKDDFRREIMNYMGGLAAKGKTFKYDSNEQLYKAFEKKLFEDIKDSIKLSALAQDTATVVDKELLDKINTLKQRLIKDFGYDDDSAQDVLTYVGSIFARGDDTDT